MLEQNLYLKKILTNKPKLISVSWYLCIVSSLSLQIADAMLKAGANLEIPNSNGRRPISIAAAKWNVPLLMRFMPEAQVSCCDKDGMNILHILMQNCVGNDVEKVLTCLNSLVNSVVIFLKLEDHTCFSLCVHKLTRADSLLFCTWHKRSPSGPLPYLPKMNYLLTKKRKRVYVNMNGKIVFQGSNLSLLLSNLF